jgi:hypothetical protein
MEETVGRFYCLHSNCKNVDEKSFESRTSFVEHWNDKHATVKNNENTFQVKKSSKEDFLLILTIFAGGKKLKFK